MYDLAIIGAGAGGLTIAAVSAQLNLKVALIENHKMGGDCLNYGCVPSKSLLAMAKRAQTLREYTSIDTQAYYKQALQHVHETISHIAQHDSEERFTKLGADVIKGQATFKDHKTLCVNDKPIAAKRYIIATGSIPLIPDIPGLDQSFYYTNETIFDLNELPEHLVVIGAGPIGCELAQAYRSFGAEVTLITHSGLLPKDDPEAVAVIRARFNALGIKVLEHTYINKIEQQHGLSLVHCDSDHHEQIIKASHLLVATGRKPCLDNLNLDDAGVAFDQHGIKTSAKLKTSNKKIFAVGDVIHGPNFTHVAGYHGGLIIKNLLFKLPSKCDYTTLPWITYTDPELAQVGLHMLDAKKYNIPCQSTTLPFADNDRAQCDKTTEGFIKVLTDKRARILGVTIVGHHAGDLLPMWSLAMQEKLPLSKIAKLMIAYPSLAEVNKQVASRYYADKLYSTKTQQLIRFLKLFG